MSRAPFSKSPPLGGEGGTPLTHPSWTPPPPISCWAQCSSAPSANQNFSLAPSAPITLDQKFFSEPSRPLNTQHHLGGQGAGPPPPPPLPLQGHWCVTSGPRTASSLPAPCDHGAALRIDPRALRVTDSHRSGPFAHLLHPASQPSLTRRSAPPPLSLTMHPGLSRPVPCPLCSLLPAFSPCLSAFPPPALSQPPHNPRPPPPPPVLPPAQDFF